MSQGTTAYKGAAGDGSRAGWLTVYGNSNIIIADRVLLRRLRLIPH